MFDMSRPRLVLIILWMPLYYFVYSGAVQGFSFSAPTPFCLRTETLLLPYTHLIDSVTMPSAPKNNKKTHKNKQATGARPSSPAARATASAIAKAAQRNPVAMSRRSHGSRQTLLDTQLNPPVAAATARGSTTKQAPPGPTSPSVTAPNPPTLVETTPGVSPDGPSLVNTPENSEPSPNTLGDSNPSSPERSLQTTQPVTTTAATTSVYSPPKLTRFQDIEDKETDDDSSAPKILSKSKEVDRLLERYHEPQKIKADDFFYEKLTFTEGMESWWTTFGRTSAPVFLDATISRDSPSHPTYRPFTPRRIRVLIGIEVGPADAPSDREHRLLAAVHDTIKFLNRFALEQQNKSHNHRLKKKKQNYLLAWAPESPLLPKPKAGMDELDLASAMDMDSFVTMKKHYFHQVTSSSSRREFMYGRIHIGLSPNCDPQECLPPLKKFAETEGLFYIYTDIVQAPSTEVVGYLTEVPVDNWLVPFETLSKELSEALTVQVVAAKKLYRKVESADNTFLPTFNGKKRDKVTKVKPWDAMSPAERRDAACMAISIEAESSYATLVRKRLHQIYPEAILHTSVYPAQVRARFRTVSGYQQSPRLRELYNHRRDVHLQTTTNFFSTDPLSEIQALHVPLLPPPSRLTVARLIMEIKGGDTTCFAVHGMQVIQQNVYPSLVGAPDEKNQGVLSHVAQFLVCILLAWGEQNLQMDADRRHFRKKLFSCFSPSYIAQNMEAEWFEGGLISSDQKLATEALAQAKDTLAALHRKSEEDHDGDDLKGQEFTIEFMDPSQAQWRVINGHVLPESEVGRDDAPSDGESTISSTSRAGYRTREMRNTVELANLNQKVSSLEQDNLDKERALETAMAQLAALRAQMERQDEEFQDYTALHQQQLDLQAEPDNLMEVERKSQKRKTQCTPTRVPREIMTETTENPSSTDNSVEMAASDPPILDFNSYPQEVDTPRSTSPNL